MTFWKEWKLLIGMTIDGNNRALICVDFWTLDNDSRLFDKKKIREALTFIYSNFRFLLLDMRQRKVQLNIMEKHKGNKFKIQKIKPESTLGRLLISVHE